MSLCGLKMEEFYEFEPEEETPPPPPSRQVLLFDYKRGMAEEMYAQKLLKIFYVPTKFMDKETLKMIDIYKDVWFFSKIRLGKLIRMAHPSYKELTAKFLASACLKIPPMVGDGKLTFSIGHTNYSIIIVQLGDVLRFQNSGHRSFPSSRRNAPVWKTIGDPDYFGGKI